MIRLILGLIRPQEGETVIIVSNGKTVPMKLKRVISSRMFRREIRSFPAQSPKICVW